MTTDTTAAHDLLVLADPVPSPPTFDDGDVARVVRQASTAADPTVVRRLRRDPSRRRRFVIGVGVVAVTAAVASVAASVLPQGERIGVPPPAAAADPVAVLRLAADVAAAEPFTAPRADQFLYVDSGSSHAWYSVDGTQDDLVVNSAEAGTSGGTPLPGCRDGVHIVGGNDEGVRPQPCAPDPAYLPDMPTDPAALRAWLVVACNGAETNNVAEEVLYLLESKYLAPAARAGLFDVVSTYDGLAVSTDGVAAGRVAVTWEFSGFTHTLLFSATDHRFLGLRSGGGGTDFVGAVVVDAVGQTG